MAQLHYLERELYERIGTDPEIFDFLQVAVMDGLWYWDIEQPEHEWMSPRFWQVLGYDPSVKKHLVSEWQDLIHPDDLQVSLKNFERHCADPSHPYDQVVRYRHADGSTVWVRCRGKAIRGPDGTPLRMLGAHTELTPLKRREQELRRANAALEQQTRRLVEARRASEEQSRATAAAHAKYLDLFDNAPDMLAIVDADEATLVECNRALASKLGYDRAELVGRSVFDLYHPSSLNAARGVFLEFRVTGLVREAVLRMRSKEGRVLDVVLNASDVRDPEGRLLYKRAAWHDITDRKRAEAEKARHNEDLQTLLHVMSHDLREPLRAINTFSRMLQDRCSSQLDEKGRDYLARVSRAGERLDRLVLDIVQLSRAKHEQLAKRDVTAREIVDRALSQLEVAIGESGARIRVEPTLPVLRVDRIWAVQAVSNLLSNALKFRVPDAAPDLEIGGYRAEPGEEVGAGIIVRDRGPGVLPDQADRIFDLFQRAVGREVHGTGAGLAIVRQVAKQHGGAAWVRPRSGGGSEFIVTFGEFDADIERGRDDRDVAQWES